MSHNTWKKNFIAYKSLLEEMGISPEIVTRRVLKMKEKEEQFVDPIDKDALIK